MNKFAPSLPRDTRRQARSRQKVLTAAALILSKRGYAGLTIEAVATASGVAKTTIYRQWSSRAALCMDVYFHVADGQLASPDTGDISSDLKQIAASVLHLQTKTAAGPALIGLLSEAQREGQDREALLKEFAERRRDVTRSALLRGIKRGQVRRDLDVDLFIDAMGGAFTFRLLQAHAPLNRRFTDALVDMLLQGWRTST